MGIRYFKLGLTSLTIFGVLSVHVMAGGLSNWTTLNSMHEYRWDCRAVAIQGYLYAIGGVDFTSNDSVERAQIMPDGSLGSWEYVNKVNVSGRSGFATITANNSIYIIGGYSYLISTNGYPVELDSIEQATVNPDSTLGPWSLLSSHLVIARDRFASVVVNNQIYVMGGEDTSATGEPVQVEQAVINTDGTLGQFVLSTSQMIEGEEGCLGISFQNYIILLGGANYGINSTSGEFSEVYPDGQLGSWQGIYNNSLYSHTGVQGGSISDGQYTYIIFGNGSSPDYVLRAELFSMGSVGPTEELPSLGVGDVFFGTAISFPFIYVVGGYNFTYGDLNSIEEAKILDGPPIFPTLASLKLFTGQGLTPAFNIEDYNTGDMSTSYSILSNFQDLSSLDNSSVTQASYDSPTTGTNIYLADNAYGEGTATNEVKYSTYKIYKLPKVGLTVGSSWDVNVANYTYDSIRLAIPPSFGSPDAIIVSDTTLVSAAWSGNTIIHITSLQPFSGAVNVDVIASPDSSAQSFNSKFNIHNSKLLIDVTASPNATSPFGIDIDKERIQVYTNLLSNSTFSTSNDTSIWMPFELAPGRTELATQYWLSSYNDSAGTQAFGVWKFSFADGNSGVKSTPKVSNWVPMTASQWYTVRMRLVADTPNNAHQSILFGYNNYVGTGLQTDIAANVLFGIPTVWTWEETPLLVHGTSTGGYPQFQFKASTSGNIYIDEIQIINSAPTLIDAQRGNTQMHYAYGNFDDPSETTGWGQQIYVGAGSAPEISVSNNELVLTFNSATSGTGQQGIKWTANNGIQGMGAATFSTTPGREVGVRATVTLPIGTFNSSGIILIAGYGVQTSGQQSIGISPSNLFASAGVGSLVGGTYRTVASAVNPYYQFQFGVRSDVQGTLTVSDVDLDRDQDDPNFGDATLFP